MSDTAGIMDSWRTDPERRGKALMGLCGNKPHAFIGDFLVFSALVLGGSRNHSGIMHVPSGRWRALERSFRESKEIAETMTSDQARDTVVWLHEA